MSQKRETHYERKKMGKHLLSHRYNLLPLLRSRPGGVQKELIVKDLPGTNVAKDINPPRGKFHLFSIFVGFNYNILSLKRLRDKKNILIFMLFQIDYSGIKNSFCYPKLF
jgi:hypothetical protein